MEYIEFNGSVLNINEYLTNEILDYLLNYDDILLYDNYEDNTLRIVGGCSCNNKDVFINNFLDLLDKLGVCHIGFRE